VIGGSCVSALHPTKPFVAYTSGKSLLFKTLNRLYDHRF
jgi:hypothetical protein